jgi:hypothetical protein
VRDLPGLCMFVAMGVAHLLGLRTKHRIGRLVHGLADQIGQVTTDLALVEF